MLIDVASYTKTMIPRVGQQHIEIVLSLESVSMRYMRILETLEVERHKSVDACSELGGEVFRESLLALDLVKILFGDPSALITGIVPEAILGSRSILPERGLAEDRDDAATSQADVVRECVLDVGDLH